MGFYKSSHLVLRHMTESLMCVDWRKSYMVWNRHPGHGMAELTALVLSELEKDLHFAVARYTDD